MTGFRLNQDLLEINLENCVVIRKEGLNNDLLVINLNNLHVDIIRVLK